MKKMKQKKQFSETELFGIERVFEYFKYKKKYYKISSSDGKLMFVETPKKDVEYQLKMAKELANHLKKDLEADKVLVEVFMTRYDKKSLEKLYKYTIQGKRKYKARTREGHCVDMKVGNHIVPLVD